MIAWPARPVAGAVHDAELRELGDLRGHGRRRRDRRPGRCRRHHRRGPGSGGQDGAQNIKILRSYAERGALGRARRIVFKFQTSPIEIKGTDRVESIVLGHNDLIDDGGRIVAKDSGHREELPAQLVVRAVGYRGVPTAGLPFDERAATIPHTEGRVEGSRNEYVVGWIKRGRRA